MRSHSIFSQHRCQNPPNTLHTPVPPTHPPPFHPPAPLPRRGFARVSFFPLSPPPPPPPGTPPPARSDDALYYEQIQAVREVVVAAAQDSPCQNLAHNGNHTAAHRIHILRRCWRRRCTVIRPVTCPVTRSWELRPRQKNVEKCAQECAPVCNFV